MQVFKKIFTATLITCVILSIAGIVYVVQFQEEKQDVQEGKTAEKAIKIKSGKTKSKMPDKAATAIPTQEISIIIDDIGYDLNVTKALASIQADLTFAILPFQKHSRESAAILHQAKREILLHLPMEPVSYPEEKPGEGALFTDMSDEELVYQLKKNIAAVPYVSGVNNHMGSRFMIDELKLTVVFKELKKANMFFVDSRTSPDTKTAVAAKTTGLKVAERKIFLDNHRNYNIIYNNIMQAAQGNGLSPKIMIGHPYPETIQALRDAVDDLRKKNISIVPVSRLIKTVKTSS
jgi:hypothetical protein